MITLDPAEVGTLKDLITVSVLCLSPSLAWLTLCYNWYTKFDEIWSQRRRALDGISEEVKHIQSWTGTGYDEASDSLNWYNPTFGVLPFPSEKIHEFNALSEPDQYGQALLGLMVALEASIDRFRALVNRPQEWAGSATKETIRSVMGTMEYDPAGAMGWRVRGIDAAAVAALSTEDQQWRQELYRRNRDLHVTGIGGAVNEEGLFAVAQKAASAIAQAKASLNRPIRPKRFWIGHVLAVAVGLIGVLFLCLFFYIGASSAQPTTAQREASSPSAERGGVPQLRTYEDTSSVSRPHPPRPDNLAPRRQAGPLERASLSFWDHVNLVLLAALLSLVFWGMQRALEYVVNRDRRHHKAIAQLEYMLGRRFHRLGLNITAVKYLEDTIRSGQLGAMFPTPLHPDDSPCIELYNLGVINAVLRVNERMEGLDYNMGTLQTLYLDLRDAFARNPDDPVARKRYEENAVTILQVYASLREEMLKTHGELVRVLAWLKILGQRDKPGIRRLLRGQSRKSAPVNDEEVETMVKEIERLAVGPHRFRPQPGTAGPKTRED